MLREGLRWISRRQDWTPARDYAGIDLLEGPDGPVVLEVNASPGWQGIKSATGKNYTEIIIEYGVGRCE